MKILKANGHEILVTARNKEITLDLLDKFGMNYVEVGRYRKNNASKAVEMFRIDYKLYKLAKRFNLEQCRRRRCMIYYITQQI